MNLKRHMTETQICLSYCSSSISQAECFVRNGRVTASLPDVKLSGRACLWRCPVFPWCLWIHSAPLPPTTAPRLRRGRPLVGWLRMERWATHLSSLSWPPRPPLITATSHFMKSSFHIFISMIWLFYFQFFCIVSSFFFYMSHSVHSCVHSSSLRPPWPLLFWFPPQRFIHPSEHPVLSIPFIGMIVIVAVVWCWLSELASQRARYGRSLSLSAEQVVPGKNERKH